DAAAGQVVERGTQHQPRRFGRAQLVDRLLGNSPGALHLAVVAVVLGDVSARVREAVAQNGFSGRLRQAPVDGPVAELFVQLDDLGEQVVRSGRRIGQRRADSARELSYVYLLDVRWRPLAILALADVGQRVS